LAGTALFENNIFLFNMKKQELRNKIGEISFRKELSSQQTGGEIIFEDEFSPEDIEKILIERMEKTKRQIQLLKDQGILMSPYLELGAERGQRSLVMENDFNFKGVASDLSYDMLLTCDHYGNKFGKNKIPLRVCCDAYNLPFLSDSIPFVFCYETLHHFPNPEPIIKEIIRVLSPGGYFFFDEEPCRGILQFRLFKAKNKIYSIEAQKRGIVKKIIEYFFYQKSCNEVDHGIIENDSIFLVSWKKMLNLFKNKNIALTSSKSLFATDIFRPKSPVKLILAYLLGGTMKGICRKEGTSEGGSDISDLFRCPDCAEKNIQSKLYKNEKSNLYSCNRCKNVYPEMNKVQFLFPEKEFKQLYNHLNNN